MDQRTSAVDLYLALLRWGTNREKLPRQYRDSLWSAGQPLVAELRSKKLDSLLYLASEQDAVPQRVYDKVWEIQRRAAVDILRKFDAAGIPTLVIKGSEVLNRHFSPHGLSFLNDVDLLVDRNDVQAAKRLLYGAGYAQHLFNLERQSLFPRDIQEIADIEVSHYELAPFNRLEEVELTDEEGTFVRTWNWHPVWAIGDQYFVVVEFDVHYKVAYDVLGDEFFPRCVPSSFGAGNAMSPADQLWFVTSRFYNEVGASGKVVVRDLAYVTALLASGEIDWSIVIEAAAHYDLRPSLYYYLAFANWLAGGAAIPSQALDLLRPSLGSRQRDWGWQLAKLLGTDEEFTPIAIGKFARTSSVEPVLHDVACNPSSS